MQGRLRSTRLPCKGFFTFFDQTIWERMCDIATDISYATDVVFATGDIPENYIAKNLIEAKGVSFFAGSEDNVLERFCKIAEKSDAEYIVRITCDNYLIQPEVIEELIKGVLENKADYGYIEPLSHFSGEVIKKDVLLSSWKNGNPTDMALEHVTWDIRNNSALNIYRAPNNLCGIKHELKITLDTVDDFILMKNLEFSNSSLRNLRCLDAIKSIVNTNEFTNN